MLSAMQPLILPYRGIIPRIHTTAWIAPGAVVTGRVSMAAYSSILFNCVARGDVNRIEIGEGSNIQDLTMLHVADDWPCIIGSEVTVGHGAIVHGCVVEDGCLIGMGARVLNGAVIGRGSIVAAGAVVPEGMQVAAGSLVAGVPAQVRAQVSAKHIAADAASMLDAAEDLRLLPGTYWARKYRIVVEQYREALLS
jgi:carbonic anhydrase/acetyltransferase-like protein (isoleucine patch superfamily)